MCKSSVEIFLLVLSEHCPIKDGCLLSILECFCPNTIDIAEILLFPLNVPIVNKHYSSQRNKEQLFGNVTLIEVLTHVILQWAFSLLK